jgi:hypothetical protein
MMPGPMTATTKAGPRNSAVRFWRDLEMEVNGRKGKRFKPEQNFEYERRKTIGRVQVARISLRSPRTLDLCTCFHTLCEAIPVMQDPRYGLCTFVRMHVEQLPATALPQPNLRDAIRLGIVGLGRLLFSVVIVALSRCVLACGGASEGFEGAGGTVVSQNFDFYTANSLVVDEEIFDLFEHDWIDFVYVVGLGIKK